MNLKDADSKILAQYVDLRNEYHRELSTQKVGFEETVRWLDRANVIAEVIVQNNELLGVGIIYLDRNNELTYFVKYPHRGIGTTVLRKMEGLASANRIEKLWAKVNSENTASIRCFIKNEWVQSKSENGKVYFAKVLKSHLPSDSEPATKGRAKQ